MILHRSIHDRRRHRMRRMISVMLVVVAIGGAGICMAQADLDRGLLFYASYDVSPKADKSGGRGEPINKDYFFRQIAGVRGKAFISGVAGFEYLNAGNFNMPRGTFSIWFEPIDWLGTKDPKNRFELFQQGNGSRLGYFGIQVERWGHPDPQLLLYSIAFADRKNIYLQGGGAANGVWHHLVFTWDKREIRLYIDGNFVSSGELTTPFTQADLHSKQFVIGGMSDEHTAIDEVRIWDRPLSSAEIVALYQSEKP